MRRLIACADGTWNTPDHFDRGVAAPTNVVKLARAIKPEASDGVAQIVFYHRGVGTDNILDKLTGGALGVGLSRNVRELYLFLVNNYRAGDEIYFFGFSRGAYTVRSTTGMIRKIGLVLKRYSDKDLEGWRIYRETEGGPDSHTARHFREEFSRWPLRIKFLGVWDTVGALGIPGLLNFIGKRRFQFHDVALSRSVDFAYQALAIDEKRRFFKPTLWQQNPEAVGQTLEQAWFPGVHMDIGGGYRDPSLADASLRWMVERARIAGIEFDDGYLGEIAHPNAEGPLHESRTFPYTIIPAYARPIGLGVPKELSVHEGGPSNEVLSGATYVRYAKQPGYRPKNLVDYINRFRRGGPGSPPARG
jgi:uncharacterized protein (DUF2235 family)